MKWALVIVLGLTPTVKGSPTDVVRWHVEAIYSPTIVNERREGETDLHLFAHSFVIAAPEKNEHPAIKRITVGPFIVKSEDSERRMKKIEALTAGVRVLLMVEAPAKALHSAEKSGTGVLWIDSDQIEVLNNEVRANHSPEATPGQRPPATPSSSSGAPHL